MNYTRIDASGAVIHATAVQHDGAARADVASGMWMGPYGAQAIAVGDWIVTPSVGVTQLWMPGAFGALWSAA